MQIWKPTTTELESLAYDYIVECVGNTKDVATGSGKIVEIRDRHIPTVDYFLRFWIPMQKKKGICPSTYYKWLDFQVDEGEEMSDDEKAKTETIKNIDLLFKSLATDIVANEGKGIFYAKNRLGMTDRQQVDTTANVNILTIDPIGD